MECKQNPRENPNWTIYRGILLFINAETFTACFVLMVLALLHYLIGTRLPPTENENLPVFIELHYTTFILSLVPSSAYCMFVSAFALKFFFTHSARALKIHFYLNVIVVGVLTVNFFYAFHIFSPASLLIGLYLGSYVLYLGMLGQLMKMCPQRTDQSQLAGNSFNLA